MSQKIEPFSGSITPLVTPFKNHEIDYDAFGRFVNWQIEQGVDGLVVNGTTGESVTLSREERRQLTTICIQESRGRVPVISGSGTNNTEESIALTKDAKDLGADGVLLIAPYYNKPNQEGLYQHFKAIHDAVEVPIILYNNPGRVVVNMEPQLIVRLAQLPRILGIKDAPNNLGQPLLVQSELDKIGISKNDFTMLSGDDMTSLAFNIQGGSGCISAAGGNVIPQLFTRAQHLSLVGRYRESFGVYKSFANLLQVMFCDTNPVPVKYALSLMGHMSDEVRLPLVGLDDDKKALVRNALKELDLI